MDGISIELMTEVVALDVALFIFIMIGFSMVVGVRRAWKSVGMR